MTTGELRRRRQWDTSWAELMEAQADVPTATGPQEKARFAIGPEDDADAPVVHRVRFAPHHRVEPHTHPTDYAEILLEGTQQIGRTWYGPGDIRVVRANTPYGPLVAGPEGCTVLIIFRTGDWAPIWRGSRPVAEQGR